MAESAADALSGKKKGKTPAKPRKRRYRKTEIEHHSDGSHTIRHIPAEGGGEEKSYAVADDEAMHRGLDENVGAEPQVLAQATPAPAPSPMAAPTPQAA